MLGKAVPAHEIREHGTPRDQDVLQSSDTSGPSVWKQNMGADSVSNEGSEGVSYLICISNGKSQQAQIHPQTKVWEYPLSALVLEEVGLSIIKYYVQVRIHTITANIVD